jgi:hypothetical protein
MAKKGGSKTYQLPGLRQALAAVNSMGKQMGQERMGDYKVAASASAAGQANLARQTRALSRGLVLGQKQNAAAIGRLSDRARASQRQVANKQANSVSRYGSALAGSASSQFGQARATAKAGAQVVGGQAKAGKAMQAIAGTVAAFAGNEVAAQNAAAKYSLNQALQQRTIVDNQTLAGLTEDLYKQSLAYNAQMQMYQQQRADAAADAKKAELAQTRDTLGFLQESTPEIGAWMQNELDTNHDTYYKDGQLDIAALKDAYATHIGIDPAAVAPGSQDATRLDVVLGIAREVQNGADINTATTTALNTLYGGMQGWDKMAPKQLSSITAGIGAATEGIATANLQALGALNVSISSQGFGGGFLGDINKQARDAASAGATTVGFRDAAAYHIQEQYGAPTAKAWLRGQTNWSDSAIDAYLGTLNSGVTEGYEFSNSGGGSVPAASSSTPAPRPRGLG